MAAGSAFTLEPHEVITIDPEYHNVITTAESMKKDYQNQSVTPTEKYKLIFKYLTNANRDVLLNHYKDQKSGYNSFSWQSVPSYIDSGVNKTGRWEEGSYNNEIAGTMWRCEIIFETEV
jgi:hypothetical protein